MSLPRELSSYIEGKGVFLLLTIAVANGQARVWVEERKDDLKAYTSEYN